MNKNILFFISSLQGGAENQLYKIFELLKRENNVRYIVAKNKISNQNIVGLNKKKTFFSIFGLTREIITFKPDILFTTLPTPNLLNVLLKKTWFFSYRSVCRIANYNIHLKTTRFIIKNADILYFNSLENLNIYAKAFPSFKNKFVYLNNIINSDNKIINKAPSDTKIKALTASRLVQNKGIDLAIKAMNEISHLDISLDIYGEGMEAEYLKSISKNPNITFKGYSDNFNNIWGSYNLFLLPSRKEGMSNALIEAQFNNIFSIVSDCRTGNKEIIELTNNGICFPTDNYLELKNCIVKFYNSKILSKNSHNTIFENFSEKNAKSILRRTLTI